MTVQRAGFPFFDLYRLVVILRGERLVADVEQTRVCTRRRRLGDRSCDSSIAPSATTLTRLLSVGSCLPWPTAQLRSMP